MIDYTITRCSADFMAIILLCLTITLVLRNPILTKQKSHFYISISLIVILLVINEISLAFIESINNPKFYTLDVIGNVIGFTLTPTSGILMGILFNERFKKWNVFLAIPLLPNMIFALSSPWTKFYFTISPECIYARGYGYMAFIIHTGFSLVIFFSAAISNMSNYEKEYQPIMILPASITVLGFVLQMTFTNLILGWGCASISIFLNYILLREIKYGYDPLTGMHSRGLFQKKMEQLTKDDNAFIIIFDINNLKSVNDKYGHLMGDKLITETANIIAEEFAYKATAYRIGGDEFCVLTHNLSNEQIDKILLKIDAKIKRHPPICGIPLSIAYGYATCANTNMSDAYECFSIADSLMYLNKQYVKEAKSENKK